MVVKFSRVMDLGSLGVERTGWRTGHLCAGSICPVNSNQVISRGLRECKQKGRAWNPPTGSRV